MNNAKQLAIHGFLLHVVSRWWLRALRDPWVKTYCSCLLHRETVGKGIARDDCRDLVDQPLGVFGIG